MMNIIADTNIFLAVILDEPEKDKIIQLTSNANAISPDVLPYEVGNALSAMVKRKRLSASDAIAAFEGVRSIPVRLVSVDVQKALKIALEHHIYAYDAYFLQCAKQLSYPLITLDKKMKQVAYNLNIEVLE